MLSLKRRILWLAVYDPVNYTRWGLVYIVDMTILPQTTPYVWNEFRNGNLVVKKTKQKRLLSSLLTQR